MSLSVADAVKDMTAFRAEIQQMQGELEQRLDRAEKKSGILDLKVRECHLRALGSLQQVRVLDGEIARLEAEELALKKTLLTLPLSLLL